MNIMPGWWRILATRDEKPDAAARSGGAMAVCYDFPSDDGAAGSQAAVFPRRCATGFLATAATAGMTKGNSIRLDSGLLDARSCRCSWRYRREAED
jgi:hypothetical protein